MSELSNPLGRRALAAIMFTDAVEFSAAVHANEELALSQLHRDLELMRAVCAEHEGQVLKNTGDGLLVIFVSAIQAVATALKIQERLRDRSAPTGGARPLLHRIGIHLGDVLVTERDVLGDGVNLARRLQEEAEPGCICISQTTYEVVKNRLPLEAVSIGERELKNIHETVALYHIRPAGAPAAPPRRAHREMPRGLLIGGGAVAVVLLGLLGGWAAIHMADSDKKPSEDGQLAPISSPARQPAPQQVPGATGPSQTGNTELDAMRQRFRQQNDFAGLAKWLESVGAAEVVRDARERKELADRYHRLDALIRSFQGEVSKRTEQNPLTAEALTGHGPVPVKIWTDAKRMVHISDGKNVQTFPLAQMTGINAAQVLMGQLRQSQVSGHPMAEDKAEDIRYLAREFGMPTPPAPGQGGGPTPGPDGGPGFEDGGPGGQFGPPGGGPPGGFDGGGPGGPPGPGGGGPGGPPGQPNGGGGPGQPGGFGQDGRPIPYGRPGELNGVNGNPR